MARISPGLAGLGATECRPHTAGQSKDNSQNQGGCERLNGVDAEVTGFQLSAFHPPAAPVRKHCGQGVSAFPFLGTIGDVGCFSFFSNKNLVTGEGGMVTTDRDDVADRVRLLRSHGMSSLTWDRHKGHAATYDVLDHGFNYRIDEIRSAIGREQLRKLDRNNQRRRELTAHYWDQLEPLTKRGWTLPFRASRERDVLGDNVSSPTGNQSSITNDRGVSPSCHLLAVVAPDVHTRWHCAETLKQAGIQTSLHYPFIPDFSGFDDDATKDTGLDVSRGYCERVITLPLFPTMSEEQLGTICSTLLAAAGDSSDKP